MCLDEVSNLDVYLFIVKIFGFEILSLIDSDGVSLWLVVVE